MKDLLQTTRTIDWEHFVVGLGDRAFAVLPLCYDDVHGATSPVQVVELEAPPLPTQPPPPPDQDSRIAGDDDALPSPNEIQAVGIVLTNNDGHERSSCWCAVARYNKTLALYRLEANDQRRSSSSSSSSGTSATTTTRVRRPPCTVFLCPKRVSCLSFVRLAPEDATSTTIVAGDLAGDATAYPLLIKDQPTSNNSNNNATVHGRLLLGHTASMLTALRTVSSKLPSESSFIVTADRDEKIRISRFPDSHRIEGYLMGHTAFVSGMDVCQTTMKCVTCGGDGTVRLWDLRLCRQLDVYETIPNPTNDAIDDKSTANVSSLSPLLPTRVAMSANGEFVAVIYDTCTKMDVLSVVCRDGVDLLELECSIDCPVQPLAVQFLSDRTLLVLTTDPQQCMVAYDRHTAGWEALPPKSIAGLRAVLDPSTDIVMPKSILETDRAGRITFQKKLEERGPAKNNWPWNRVERLDKARKSSSRRKRRKRQEREEAAASGIVAVAPPDHDDDKITNREEAPP